MDEKTNSRIPSSRALTPRELSDDEKQKLIIQNKRMVMPFVADKLETDARKHWDQFYKRNKTNFFKDRHWTTSEFNELLNTCESNKDKCLLEVGCGVGNLIFPLLEEGTLFTVYACDFSKRAIEMVKQNPLYTTSTITAFVADVTTTDLSDALKGVKMDIVTLIFVLSAIHPDKLIESARNIYNCMNPGAYVLFRDYAVNDMTQIRFKPGHKIEENLYMRQDGTRTLFFTIDLAKNIFSTVGFKEIECCYVHCRTVNKKEGIDAPRTFIQAKFMKPII